MYARRCWRHVQVRVRGCKERGGMNLYRPFQSTSARRLLFLSTTTTTSAKRFDLSFPSPFPSHYLKYSPRMSSTHPDSPPSDLLSLSTQPHHPVRVVAAHGVMESHFRSAVKSSLFRNWVKNLEGEGGILANGAACLKQVLIQGVDMFGNQIGFLKFKADIFDNETGKMIPGIVFARGPAVAVLILLYSEGLCYAILTEQARVPAGKMLLELPAGMLDDDKGDFVGTAVREVEEETGIKLNLEDMVDLTSFLDPSTGCRIFPSPGGCDEEISVFLYRGHVEKETIDQLQGREGGLPDHGELIRVRVVPYDELWRKTPDAKVLIAVALYEMAARNGLLPPLKA